MKHFFTRYYFKKMVPVLVLLTSSLLAFGQTTVTGVVESAEGEALIGASVLLKGTTTGVVTDLDGSFTLEVPDNQNAVLVISYTGFETLEVPIAGRTSISVELQEDILAFQDVVVIGYASKKRTDVTGSIASLKVDKFNAGVISSPEQLLQAKIPGVRVTSASGEPGAAVNVTIRGAGSLRSGNSPLYVIDGVPLSNESVTPGSSNVVGSNAGNTASAKNPLNFLNPDDIESIDVLKDASATAIYGSRGSNGVILITTKRGSARGSSISYNGYVGTSSMANKIDLEGAGSGTDWQDEITRTAYTFNHNVALSGGNDNAQYRASLSYMDQEGIIRTSALERYTARINSRIFALPDSRLQLNINLIASHVNDNGIPRSDIADTDGELITNTLAGDPGRPVFDPTTGDYSSGPTNAVGLLESWNDVTKTDRVLSSISASYEITDGLKYQNNLGIDRSSAIREQELLPNNLEGVNLNNGSYSYASIDASNFLIENFLTYDKVFAQSEIGLLVGHAYQKFSVNGTSYQLSDYLVPTISALDDPGNATALVGGSTNPDGIREENKLESVFARVNYGFGDNLLVTASIRADGSSKFGENNRWGYFPAFSGAYQLKNVVGTSMFSDLKARVGWGRTGNQEIPNKATQETYEVTDNGITRVREANPDLKWEVSEQFNIGIDFETKNRKLYGTLDYFNRVNSDPLLLVDSEPPSVSQVWVNLPGEIKNNGVEIYLGSELVNTGNVVWNVDFNGTFTNNEVVIPDGREILTGVLSGRSLTGELIQIIRDGEALGSFYLPGDNGDGTSGEREIAGEGIPNFVYGINTYLKVKNLDVAMNMSGVSGNMVYNATDNFLNNFGGNVSSRIASADAIPAGASTFFLEDGSFLRLNNLTVGYNLPTNNTDWLSGARLYITGQNLFVITDYTGYDPEVNTAVAAGGNLSYGIDFASYPRARTFILGINVTF